MKKVLSVFVMLTLIGLGTIVSQDKNIRDKKKSQPSNLMMVEKTVPVPDAVKEGFESINGSDALHHLRFLASDTLEGRDTGTNGYQIAAEYAATMFALMGLKPAGDKPKISRRNPFRPQPKNVRKPTQSYLQQIVMKEYLDSSGSAKVEYRKGKLFKSTMFEENVDYQFFTRNSQVLSAPVVFAGYGISEKSLKYDAYKNIDAKGKIVMLITEIPRVNDKKTPFAKKEIKSKYMPRMTMSRFARSGKIKIAQEKGAIAVIMVENDPAKNGDIGKKLLDQKKINDEKPIFPGRRRQVSLINSSSPMPFEMVPVIRVSRKMANDILKSTGNNIQSLKNRIEKDLKPRSMSLTGITFSIKNRIKTKLIKSPNVLGYIEGSDPALKDEVIVIGAHLDHIGKRGDYIFNGADDNGSGSVAVIEMAQAFAVNPAKPKRTILFALWTGEEKGLLGSRYYVENPYFPIEKTVANLNLDMVSREWDKKRLMGMARYMGTKITDEEIKKIDTGNFLSISFDGNDPNIRKMIQKSNLHVGMSLMFRPAKNIRQGGGGSDHMPFAMKKIPWIFVMSGFHEDYHQPSDSVGKINDKLMKSITRLGFLTVYSLADR